MRYRSPRNGICRSLYNVKYSENIMPDPATIGELVASVLNLAVSESFKKLLGEAASDAYKALKTKVAAWRQIDKKAAIDEISPGPQATLAEIIDRQPQAEKELAKELAHEVLRALKQNAAGKVGFEAERLEALDILFGAINVTDGTGARLGIVKADGTFRVDAINVGDRQGK
jgi:hypothetical protein